MIINNKIHVQSLIIAKPNLSATEPIKAKVLAAAANGSQLPSYVGQQLLLHRRRPPQRVSLHSLGPNESNESKTKP